MRQIICEKLPFAEMHRSRSETVNQSQEECLSSVNQACVMQKLLAEKIILQPVWSSNSLLAFEVEKTNSGQANHIVYRVGGRA